MPVYLNDIPLNLFLEYFNETNYNGSENAPIMEILKVHPYKYGDYKSPIILQNYADGDILDNVKNLFAIGILSNYKLLQDEEINVYESPIISNKNLDATEITKAFNDENPNFIQENFITLRTSKEKIFYKISNNEYSLVDSYDFSENASNDKNYFPGFKTRYKKVLEGNLNSIYIEITSIPVLKPKLNSEGKNLYTDENGNIQIAQREPNNFFKHQSAIRRTFYNLNPESSWEYKINNMQLAIINYDDGNAFSYHEDYTKTIEYEDIEELSDDPNNEIFINDKFISKDELKGSKTKYFVKQIAKKFSSYPKYTAYSETKLINNGVELYIPDLDTINPTENEKEVMLECFRRYVSVGGKKILVNNAGRITNISLYGLNKIHTDLTASVFDIETNPYIILSLFSNNDDIQNNIGSTITINIGSISINGRITGNKNNLSTVSIKFTSNTFDNVPLLTKSEIGINSKELSDSVYFIKLKFTKAEDEKIGDYLCKIKAVSIEESDTSDFIFRNTGINSKINDVEDLNENSSLLNRIQTRKKTIKISTSPSGTSGASIGQELGNNFLNNASYINSVNFPTKPLPGLIGFGNNPVGISNIKNILNSSNLQLSTIIEKSPYYHLTPEKLCKTRYKIVGPISFNISPKSIFELADEISNLEGDNNNSYSAIEYYKNPYIDGHYLKKITTYSKDSDNKISLTLNSIKLNDIIDSFKNNKDEENQDLCLLLNNNINNLRGERVSGDVIYNLKVSTLKSSLKDILNGSAENVNLKNMLNQENGFMRAYLYCKGRVESLTDKTIKDEKFNSTDLIEKDDVFNKMILFKVNIKTLLDNLETIKTSSYRDLDNRNLINRLDDGETYPLNKMYNDVENKKLNFTNFKNSLTNSTVYENINSKNIRNTTKKENTSELDKIKNLISNAFTSAYIKNNLYYLNSLDVYLSKLNLSDIESSNFETSYKKIYSNKDENFLTNILTDLLVVKEKAIMEVLDDDR